MWKNYMKSAIRIIICLPAIILDFVGCTISLLWIVARVIFLAIAKWLANIIPLSEDCPYAVAWDDFMAEVKDVHKQVFVDILDLLK